MTPIQICQVLQHSHVGTSIRKSNWLFPTIESFHIVGLTLVVGSIMWFDFRLLGFAKRDSVVEVAKKMFPVTWIGFSIAMITGGFLFASEAVMCYGNIAFRLKMLMLVLIGVNGLAYELITHRNVKQWDVASSTPFGAKLTAVVSLLLWCGVICAGRWIAYAGNE